MDTGYIFRPAGMADMGRIMEIIGQAKAQMKREGRDQWDENYPAERDISGDILSSSGYVLVSGELPVAYGAAVFSGEPAYSAIRGKWLSDLDYVVLHRLAVADEVKGRGVATVFMRKVEELAACRGIRSFKVDTRYDNIPMLKVFTRLGFSYCGEVRYGHGSCLAERSGFEPEIRFCRIHAFQACLLSHSSISPEAVAKIAIIFIFATGVVLISSSVP